MKEKRLGWLGRACLDVEAEIPTLCVWATFSSSAAECRLISHPNYDCGVGFMESAKALALQDWESVRGVGQRVREFGALTRFSFSHQTDNFSQLSGSEAGGFLLLQSVRAS